MKLIRFDIWNDYSRNKKACVYARFPKDKYRIIRIYKNKTQPITVFYLKLRTIKNDKS